ncbi:unnamed protein product [Pleuronectes platessa]|uniref:Uncharacterized protein n=1 Tax=Pleuronectes platessa TaxID=8262 RepID=A0A9N7Z993_PLEPL|nr:unnamed protein product [Pleuronectes platessa]
MEEDIKFLIMQTQIHQLESQRRSGSSKNVAGPQNSSDPEDSEASLHHTQGPKVFGRRGGLTERAHLAGDRVAGGRPENRSPKKQLELRGGGAPEPPVTYMHIIETEVFSMGVFLLRPGTSIPLHDHPDMNGNLRSC